jgi:hypothetical protein
LIALVQTTRKYGQLWALLFLTGMAMQVHGQGMYTTFGQNRVQYQKLQWSFVRSENFDAYFYAGGRELSQFAARTAEFHLNEIEREIDHRLSGRVEIMCYNSLSDFKQANFGLNDQSSNTGGYSQVTNNKIFIYFNGNHGDFERQIKSGIALVIMNELLFGGSIQDRLQNAALLNLPDWFLFGITNHISGSWSSEEDNRLKDLIVSGKIKKFNRFVQQDNRLAGMSFWRFITDKYGAEVVSNMLYITRLTRNYETALIYVIGRDLKQTSKDWLLFYKELYQREDSLRMMPNDRLKIKKRLFPYVEKEMKVSPKGDYVAFTTNKYGKYKVWLTNTKTNKSKRVLKGGLKYNQAEIDHSFPILAWHPGGEKVSYVHEKRGKIFITTLDLVSRKKQKLLFLKFDKITSLAYADNERLLVLSAIRKGQSDLYTYDLQTRKEKQLTNDPYDDVYPSFVDGSTKIIFSSNRNSDSLSAPSSPVLNPDNNLDVYIYDFENQQQRLQRLTRTPYINETHPIEYDNQYFAYLTDYNGIRNRYVARMESTYDFTEVRIVYKDEDRATDTLLFDNPADLGKQFEYEGRTINLDSTVERIDTLIHLKDLVYTYPVTNYRRNILAHHVSRQSQQLYEVILDSNRYTIRRSPLVRDVVSLSKQTESYPTMSRLKSGYATRAFTPGLVIYSHRRERHAGVPKQKATQEMVKETYDYFFVNEFTPQTLKREDIKVIDAIEEKKGTLSKSFKLNAPRFYDVTFFLDHFVAQMDNSIINTYYQPIMPGGENMFNPGLNGMFQFGVVDLMEDYRLTGGLRTAFDLSTIDYMLAYEVLKRRIDHKISFYRQVRNGTSEGTLVKNLSHEIRYQTKYPLNQVMSFRSELFTRQDREVYKAVNPLTLALPDRITNWAGVKLEFVFDNIIPRGLNLYNGTRFKIFTEHYENMTNREIQLNTFGFDFRNYQRLHRQLILCTRLTYNTSFGQSKVRYSLGGVDNWLQPRVETENSTLGTANYAFQALATNMRGFAQNIRSGNSFAVINSEIRFPVFAYLFNRPIRSEFINNFQLVPFFDIGTAWLGSDPYSDDNIYNQRIIEVKHLKVTVVNVREPIIAGYGGGLRTKLFGYFIRFDAAWGIQDRTINKKPVYYVSLSLDF